MIQLHQIVPTETDFVHICDYFKAGVQDRDWIPKIAKEGGCVLITSDGGRQSKKGEKLPLLCKAYGITHIVMSPKLHMSPSHVKIAAIASVWNEIQALHETEPGSRYDLRFRPGKDKAQSTFALVKYEDSATQS